MAAVKRQCHHDRATHLSFIAVKALLDLLWIYLRGPRLGTSPACRSVVTQMLK